MQINRNKGDSRACCSEGELATCVLINAMEFLETPSEEFYNGKFLKTHIKELKDTYLFLTDIDLCFLWVHLAGYDHEFYVKKANELIQPRLLEEFYVIKGHAHGSKNGITRYFGIKKIPGLKLSIGRLYEIIKENTKDLQSNFEIVDYSIIYVKDYIKEKKEVHYNVIF